SASPVPPLDRGCAALPMGVDDGRWRGSDDLDPAGRQRHVLGAGGSLRRTRIRAPGRTRRTPFRATSPLCGRTPNEGAGLLPVAVGYAPSSSRAGDRYGAPRRQPCTNRPRGDAGVSRVHEPAQRPSLERVGFRRLGEFRSPFDDHVITTMWRPATEGGGAG